MRAVTRHGVRAPSSKRPRSRDERGAVAVMTAVLVPALLVIAGLVLDIGLVRVDRQTDKSAADAAALSGLTALQESGDGQPHPFVGVCQALRFLAKNSPRFAGVTSASGTWSTGAGGSAGNGCTDTASRTKPCVEGDTTSWARFDWSGTYQGATLSVRIQSGYQLPDSAWPEDDLPAAGAFQDDGGQGCNQLAVVVRQNRNSAFGAVAGSPTLSSAIRTVGRVKIASGGSAPALLLLRRTGCGILTTGSSAGTSHVYVYGARSTNGRTQPGTIHSDSDGSSCSSSVFMGRGSNGIAAYAAPQSANPSLPDANKPGIVSAFAGTLGLSGTTLRDSTSKVCGSATLNSETACPGSDVIGLSRVTRKLIDKRYLGTTRSMVANANSAVFTSLTSLNATTNGYRVATCQPNGTVNSFTAATATNDKLFVDCATPTSMPAATGYHTVVFNGVPSPSGVMSLPDATKVYVFGSSSNGINLGSGKLSVHTTGNLGSDGKCSGGQSSTTADKATVFVKNGPVNESNNGLLQLCYTTMVMMGGQPGGCLPTSDGSAPTATPCGGAVGTGQLTQTGGDVDWTAPNALDTTLDTLGNPTADASAGYADLNGPEDLALWTESAGSSGMNGQASLHAVGVFMAPNADPFQVGGGACQSLNNAQYIVSSFGLNGANACLKMTVDSQAAVQMPTVNQVGLVR